MESLEHQSERLNANLMDAVEFADNNSAKVYNLQVEILIGDMSGENRTQVQQIYEMIVTNEKEIEMLEASNEELLANLTKLTEGIGQIGDVILHLLTILLMKNENLKISGYDSKLLEISHVEVTNRLGGDVVGTPELIGTTYDMDLSTDNCFHVDPNTDIKFFMPQMAFITEIHFLTADNTDCESFLQHFWSGLIM